MIYEAIHNSVSRYYRMKPITLALLTTNMCNARCVMCNIWRDGVTNGPDLLIEDFEKFLVDDLFSHVRFVVLSGGEALLREDVVQLVEAVVKNFAKLKKITIATNGLSSNLILSRIEAIASLLQSNGKIELVVQISFDALGDIQDQIRAPGASKNIIKTINLLQILKQKNTFMMLTAICVIQQANLRSVFEVYDYLTGQNIRPIFTVVCQGENYYKNEDVDGVYLNNSQKVEARTILKKLEKKEPNIGIKFLYSQFADMLAGGKNERACPSLANVMVVDPSGDVLPCLNSKGITLGNLTVKKASDIWYSNSFLPEMQTFRAEVCSDCMYACGVGYFEVLRYYVCRKLGMK